ncbi:MAG: hypothetical protein FJW96_06575, partial [Actinobacteria bacterium]|nr:hypothetical protein [Actinomycetota bacterium]
ALADTEPADTVLADTEPADTVLADTELADTVLADTELADTVLADERVETELAADPAEELRRKLAESRQVEAAPAVPVGESVETPAALTEPPVEAEAVEEDAPEADVVPETIAAEAEPVDADVETETETQAPPTIEERRARIHARAQEAIAAMRSTDA